MKKRIKKDKDDPVGGKPGEKGLSMKFLNKLERKFGRYAVPNLMLYIIILNAAGLLITIMYPQAQYYLCWSTSAILHGQIWRIVSFILVPYTTSPVNFLIFAFLYYSISQTLERVWGSFRMDMYIITGLLGTIVAAFLVYFVFGVEMGMQVSISYLSNSLFLALAATFPDVQFLLFFIIPVKAKWLSIFYFALDAYQIIQGIMMKSYYPVALIVVSLINIFIFFFFAKGRPGMAAHARQTKRKAEFKQKMHESREKGPIHRCAICGRTELDAPELDFRYCSKCDGRYEYCSEHLFTHEHVHHK